MKFWISQNAWMIRIDELEYLMHDEGLLTYVRQGIDENFLEGIKSTHNDGRI